MTRQRAVRSDSARNRERILDAALTCLFDDPAATMTAVAREAGVSRITMYGHFDSRRALIETLFARTVEQAEESLASVHVDDEPARALDELTRSSWRIVAEFHSVLGAARDELGEDAVHAHMGLSLDRVRSVIVRGQESGDFRADQSADWLTACYLAVVHGAADELRNGRVSEADAAQWVPATVSRIVAAS